jgi:hypothetical protein
MHCPFHFKSTFSPMYRPNAEVCLFFRFNPHFSSDRNVALLLPQALKEMSTRSVSLSVKTARTYG